MIPANYSIKTKSIASRNLQANSILERVHQTIDNIIRTSKVRNIELDDENSWHRILAPTMFALRVTVHTTTQDILV